MGSSHEQLRAPRRRYNSLIRWSATLATVTALGASCQIAKDKHYFDAKINTDENGKKSLEFSGPYVPETTTTLDLSDTGLLSKTVRDATLEPWCSSVTLSDPTDGGSGRVCADMKTLRFLPDGKSTIVMDYVPIDQPNKQSVGPDLYVTFAADKEACKIAEQGITEAYSKAIFQTLGKTVSDSFALTVIVDAARPTDTCDLLCTFDMIDSGLCDTTQSTLPEGNTND